MGTSGACCDCGGDLSVIEVVRCEKCDADTWETECLCGNEVFVPDGLCLCKLSAKYLRELIELLEDLENIAKGRVREYPDGDGWYIVVDELADPLDTMYPNMYAALDALREKGAE